MLPLLGASIREWRRVRVVLEGERPRHPEIPGGDSRALSYRSMEWGRDIRNADLQERRMQFLKLNVFVTKVG